MGMAGAEVFVSTSVGDVIMTVTRVSCNDTAKARTLDIHGTIPQSVPGVLKEPTSPSDVTNETLYESKVQTGGMAMPASKQRVMVRVAIDNLDAVVVVTRAPIITCTKGQKMAKFGIQESPQAGGDDGAACGYIAVYDAFCYFLGRGSPTLQEEAAHTVSPGRMNGAKAMRGFVRNLLYSPSVMTYFLAQLAQQQMLAASFDVAPELQRVAVMRAVANAVVAIAVAGEQYNRTSAIEVVSNLPAFKDLLTASPLGADGTRTEDAGDELQQHVWKLLALELFNKEDGTESTGTPEQVAAAVTHVRSLVVADGQMMESCVFSLLQFAFQSMGLFNLVCMEFSGKASYEAHVHMQHWTPTPAKSLPYLIVFHHAPALHYSAIKPGDNIVNKWAQPMHADLKKVKELLARAMTVRSKAAAARMAELERGNGNGNGGGGGKGDKSGGSGGKKCLECATLVQSLHPGAVLCDAHQAEVEAAERRRKQEAQSRSLAELRKEVANKEAEAKKAKQNLKKAQSEFDKQRHHETKSPGAGAGPGARGGTKKSGDGSGKKSISGKTAAGKEPAGDGDKAGGAKPAKSKEPRKCCDCGEKFKKGYAWAWHKRCQSCYTEHAHKSKTRPVTPTDDDEEEEEEEDAADTSEEDDVDDADSGDDEEKVAHRDLKCATPACKNKIGSNQQRYSHCLACAQARRDALSSTSTDKAGGSSRSPARKGSRSPSKSTGKCFNCDKTGHLAADCRKSKTAGKSKGGGGSSDDGPITLSKKEAQAFRLLLGAGQRLGVGRA